MYLRKNTSPLVIALAAAIACGALAGSPALALECPQAQSHNVRGALRETAQMIAARSGTLAARGSAAIPSLIFQIRKNNPDSTDGEITDYLITAYCPVVNGRQELSEQQKRADLARCSSQVRQQLR